MNQSMPDTGNEILNLAIASRELTGGHVGRIHFWLDRLERQLGDSTWFDGWPMVQSLAALERKLRLIDRVLEREADLATLNGETARRNRKV
jgi:hypothetical protein